MYSHSVKLLRTLAQNFIKPEFLVTYKINTISFSNPKMFLPECQIFIGTECEEFIKDFPSTLKCEIKNMCLQFYSTAAEEIVKRLPITNEFFKEFQFLESSICLDATKRNMATDLLITREIFERFIKKHKVLDEWRELPYFYYDDDKSKLKVLKIPELWQEISKAKDFFSDIPKFSNICTLAKLVLPLPHSNASAERIFSIVNDIKTKKRNRIGDNTLNAVTIIRSSFQDKNQTSADFKVTTAHLKLHNENMYKTKRD